ncbi:MAG: hypothetical protein GKS05_03965 [Nitrospirales bacterium]|nr:hypothetical protein [Nitrospirales bacterium]
MTHPSDQQPDTTNQEETPSPNKPSVQNQKVRKEIQVVSIPHEQDMIAEEMAELFEEDQVTHKHGSAEPEGD